MSNFLCEHCHAEIIDSDEGYVTGCDHYPIIGGDKPSSWCSRDCQVYTGRCSCPDGQPICVPRQG